MTTAKQLPNGIQARCHQHYCIAILVYLNPCSPSSMAFFTARNPSWMASLICVSVCLFGPFMRMVTDSGFLHSSINVYFSSPCTQSIEFATCATSRCTCILHLLPQTVNYVTHLNFYKIRHWWLLVNASVNFTHVNLFLTLALHALELTSNFRLTKHAVKQNCVQLHQSETSLCNSESQVMFPIGAAAADDFK